MSLKGLKVKIVDEIVRLKRMHTQAPGECFTYNSASTFFMLKQMKKCNSRVIISVGGSVEHLIPMLVEYPDIKHITMMKFLDVDDFNLEFGTNISVIYKDFFELKKREFEGDTLISHVCVHCMMDSRYKNDFKRIQSKDIRAYQFAHKMKEVCPNVKHVIVSVDVGEREKIQDNGTWLDERKFIESFMDEGFILKEKYYDVFRGSLLGEWRKRFYDDMPVEWIKKNNKAVGNYYFEMEDIEK